MPVHVNSVISTRIQNFDAELYESLTDKENYCYTESILGSVPEYQPFFSDLSAAILAYLDADSNDRSGSAFDLVNILYSALSMDTMCGMGLYPNYISHSRDPANAAWQKDNVTISEYGLALHPDKSTSPLLTFGNNGATFSQNFGLTADKWVIGLRLLSLPDNPTVEGGYDLEVEVKSGTTTLFVIGLLLRGKLRQAAILTAISPLNANARLVPKLIRIFGSWHILAIEVDLTGMSIATPKLIVRSNVQGEYKLAWEAAYANPGFISGGYRETTDAVTTYSPLFDAVNPLEIYTLGGLRDLIKTRPIDWYDDYVSPDDDEIVPGGIAVKLTADIEALANLSSITSAEASQVDAGVKAFVASLRPYMLNLTFSEENNPLGRNEKNRLTKEVFDTFGFRGVFEEINVSPLELPRGV